MEKFAAARELLAEGIEAGEYTAAVYVVGQYGKITASGALGHLGNGEPTLENSIFDLASLTKPVATASSLMVLVEQGRISLDQPVTDFFPMPHLAGITVEQLVTHTSGLSAWVDLYSQGQLKEEAIEQLLKILLENSPGEKWVYSCLGYIMLGLIIEKVAGISLAEFAAENIFKPLGMADTGFNPSNKEKRIAMTANCPGREQVLVGEVQDGNASAMEGISGNAGLFSTAGDLAVFAQTLLNSGQIYGFFTHPNEMFTWGYGFSEKAVGHTGFTGTSLLVDPAWDMFVILLTNRVFIKRDASDFLNRRRLFHNIVASAVV